MEKIIEIFNEDEKEKIAKEILKDLQEWFGIEENTKEYIENSKKLLFLSYFVKEKAVGFITLKQTSKHTAEIYVMGILKEFHGKKIGTKLYFEFENYAKKLGFLFLQVKTVESGKYKEYDITNKFYTSVGFKELEVFKNLWDPWNPCQIYVKYIAES